MMEKSAEVKKLPFFHSLSEEELGEIAQCIVIRSFRKKEVIFSEGEPSSRFLILSTGKVKITKITAEGKEMIIELISPGDFFGGFAVLNGFPYPANAAAMEDSRVLCISRKDLLGIMERFPNIILQITAQLSERVREFPDALKNIALERVESRIASLLLKLAEKTGSKNASGDIELDLRLTRQDISEMVGTTVETAIRVMSRFRKARMIRYNGGRIVVLDKKALTDIVGSLKL
jgi:CRP/FNR family transcriptional regulator